MTAEGAAYDVDRLVARHEQCRHQPRDHAQHDNGQQAPARNRPREVVPDGDLRAEELRGPRDEQFRNARGDEQRRRAEERRFEDPLEEDVSARGAEQPPGRHLAGPESGLCHREVDVVHHGKNQYHEPHAQQDVEKRPAAVSQFEGVVDRFEIEFAQRDEPHLPDDIAYIGPIDLLEEGEHVSELGLQVGTLAFKQKGNAGPAVGHAFVVGRIGLGDALGPHDDVGRRNRRAFDIAHHAADDIDALVVVHAERLSQRVKGPEDLAGERLREDDVLTGGQRLVARAFEQREVEHPEEGRVGVEYRGEELLPANLDGVVPASESSKKATEQVDSISG